MADVPRVPTRSPPGRHLAAAASAVSVALVLVLAVLKPWDGAGPGPPATATPATFYIAPDVERTGRPADYDPVLFGGREPDPAWELWPAGYVVQFGMAGPVKVARPGREPRARDAGDPSPSAARLRVRAGPEPLARRGRPPARTWSTSGRRTTSSRSGSTRRASPGPFPGARLLVENQGGGAESVSDRPPADPVGVEPLPGHRHRGPECPRPGRRRGRPATLPARDRRPGRFGSTCAIGPAAGARRPARALRRVSAAAARRASRTSRATGAPGRSRRATGPGSVEDHPPARRS